MKYLLYLSLFLSSLGVWGQRSCGTLTFEELPETQKQFLKKQERNFKRVTRRELQRAGEITIPVVFHVIWHTDIENRPDALINAQIDTLNANFRTLGIKFVLANRDPQGNPTTGIIRKYTSIVYFAANNDMKYTAKGGSDAWPRDSYLNIWVVNIGSGILGYAQFPGGSAATDGVVLYHKTLPGTTFVPYNLGKTATHEVGHWLNLKHISGDADCGNDNVDDTPVHKTYNFGCPALPKLNDCFGVKNIEMPWNYMDYVNDACMWAFTSGQGDRMRALFILNGAREKLLSSKGYSTDTVPTPPPPPPPIPDPTPIPCTDIEPNNGLWEAKLISDSVRSQISKLRDVDFFKVVAKSNVLRGSLDQMPFDLNLTIVDKNYKIQFQGFSRGLTPEVFSIPVVAGETYYLRVATPTVLFGDKCYLLKVE